MRVTRSAQNTRLFHTTYEVVPHYPPLTCFAVVTGVTGVTGIDSATL